MAIACFLGLTDPISVLIFRLMVSLDDPFLCGILSSYNHNSTTRAPKSFPSILADTTVDSSNSWT